MNGKILILGATGNVGRPLIDYLIAKDEHVKAAVYPPELDQYQAAKNVDVVSFDYYQTQTHAEALRDVNRIYIISKDTDVKPDEVLKPFIDLAKNTGVEHIVLMTGMGVERAGNKLGYWRLEQYLIGSGIDYTILRPNWFMQIFKTPFILTSIKRHGCIALPAGNGKLSFIDAQDIAAVAALSLTEKQHRGKEYTLTGNNALSFSEGAEIITNIIGRTIGYTESSNEALHKLIAEVGGYPGPINHMERMFYTVRESMVSTIDLSVQTLLGRAPISFEQFVRNNVSTWQTL